MVLFLYRSDYYDNDAKESQAGGPNKADILIAKNRHGAVGNVKMAWLAQYTKFISLSNDEPPTV